MQKKKSNKRKKNRGGILGETIYFFRAWDVEHVRARQPLYLNDGAEIILSVLLPHFFSSLPSFFFHHMSQVDTVIQFYDPPPVVEE